MSVFLFFARYTPLKKTRRYKFNKLLRISIFVRYNIFSNNKITLFIFICQITVFNYRASGGKWAEKWAESGLRVGGANTRRKACYRCFLGKNTTSEA